MLVLARMVLDIQVEAKSNANEKSRRNAAKLASGSGHRTFVDW